MSVINNKQQKGKTVSAKNKSVKQQGPGRPESKVVWPNGRFTREQAYEMNGCNTKPARMCKLTVINHLKDALTGNNSVLIQMKDELGKSKSTNGLGRKPFIYLRRSQRDAGRKAKANLIKAKVSTVTVPITSPAMVATRAPVTEPVTA